MEISVCDTFSRTGGEKCSFQVRELSQLVSKFDSTASQYMWSFISFIDDSVCVCAADVLRWQMYSMFVLRLVAPYHIGKGQT